MQLYQIAHTKARKSFVKQRARMQLVHSGSLLNEASGLVTQYYGAAELARVGQAAVITPDAGVLEANGVLVGP